MVVFTLPAITLETFLIRHGAVSLTRPRPVSIMPEPGDILILSTDGFHNLVLPELIVSELHTSTDLKSTADSLVKIALKRGRNGQYHLGRG